MDAARGNLLWYKNFKRAMYTLITASDEYVFTGSEGNSIYALDLDTGTEKWKYSTAYSSPRIDENILFSKNKNQLVFGAKQESGFSVISLNPKDGKEKWKQDFKNTSKKIKSFTEIKGYYILTTEDEKHNFYIVNAEDGKSLDVKFPKEKPLSNVIKYKDDEVAFLTKSFLTIYNLKNNTFKYRPIKIDYKINDDFNLHFDIIHKTK